jgi:hypothetical protein
MCVVYNSDSPDCNFNFYTRYIYCLFFAQGILEFYSLVPFPEIVTCFHLGQVKWYYINITVLHIYCYYKILLCFVTENKHRKCVGNIWRRKSASRQCTLSHEHPRIIDAEELGVSYSVVTVVSWFCIHIKSFCNREMLMIGCYTGCIHWIKTKMFSSYQISDKILAYIEEL